MQCVLPSPASPPPPPPRPCHPLHREAPVEPSGDFPSLVPERRQQGIRAEGSPQLQLTLLPLPQPTPCNMSKNVCASVEPSRSALIPPGEAGGGDWAGAYTEKCQGSCLPGWSSPPTLLPTRAPPPPTPGWRSLTPFQQRGLGEGQPLPIGSCAIVPLAGDCAGGDHQTRADRGDGAGAKSEGVPCQQCRLAGGGKKT